MNRIVHQLARAAATGAVALAALPAAQAAVIDFENVAVGPVGHLEFVLDKGYRLTGFSVDSGAQPGDLVGMIADGTDSGVCVNLMCPANSGHYYQGLNDGALIIESHSAGQTFSLHSFDASFIGSVPGATYPALAGKLGIYGVFADGTSAYEEYQLDGPVGGAFQFGHYLTSGGFGSQKFVELDLFAYSCDGAGACVSFTDGKGQFALDNVGISVSAVPEPASWMMLGLGLAGMAVAARRRTV